MENTTVSWLLFTRVFLLFILVAILLAALTFLFRRSPNRRVRVLAAVITLIVCRNSAYSVLVKPIFLMSKSIEDIHYTLRFGNVLANNGAASKNDSTVTYRVQPLSNYFSDLDFLDLIWCLAIGIAVYFIIVKFESVGQDSRPYSDEPHRPDYFVYNSWILLTLGVSTFMVVSVCITIPYLDQISKPTPYNVARLDSTLRRIVESDSVMPLARIEDFPYKSFRHEILEVDSFSAKFNTVINGNRSKIFATIQNGQKRFDQCRISRYNAIRQLEEFRKAYQWKQNNYARDLLTNFEREAQSKLNDKAENYQNSVLAYSKFVGNLQVQANQSLNRIYANDTINKMAFRQFVDLIRDKIFGLKPVGDTVEFDEYPWIVRYSDLPNGDSLRIILPQSKRSDKEWGYFSAMASYLITTQSSELVLLIGMFGFGLLGASLFSFKSLAEGMKIDEYFRSVPLIDNFLYVLARGFGAALIIYLATKGGLTIFTGGASVDPNGYILLLICFIGAVFSEKVLEKVGNQYFPQKTSS